jgi:hypothetical protein
MWTGVSRLAVGVTIIGGLAALLLYLGQSQAVPQVSALLPVELLRLVVYLALFVALALVVLTRVLPNE